MLSASHWTPRFNGVGYEGKLFAGVNRAYRAINRRPVGGLRFPKGRSPAGMLAEEQECFAILLSGGALWQCDVSRHCSRSEGMPLKRILILLLIPFITASDRVAETQAALTALRAEDLRVAAVAYRIAVGNHDLCPKLSPWLGIVVHDLRQYAPAYRAMVASTYDLDGGPAIEAVVSGGPAERAGAHQGDQIREINGVPVEDRFPVIGKAADYSGVEKVLAQLDAAALRGPVRLTVDRPSAPVTYTVTAEPGCQSRVQLETSKSPNASADGTMISIGLEAAAAARTVDELAVSIGHEMAHNILEHRARLDRARVSRGFWQNFGRNAREIRKTEDEADLLGLYLMARAGFDIDVAPAYWERIASQAGGDATHASAHERRAITQAIVDDIKGKQQRGEPLIPPLPIPMPLPR
jgi:hypothetical protein